MKKYTIEEKLYFESEVIRMMNEYANEALRIHDVVGQSEQLVCVGCGRTEQQHTGNGKDICPNYGGRFKAN